MPEGLRPHLVVACKVPFHVNQEGQDVHNLVKPSARLLHDSSDVFHHSVGLSLDVVVEWFTVLVVNRPAGDGVGARLAWSNTGEIEHVANVEHGGKPPPALEQHRC